MSVYTILKNKDVSRILSSYDIGTLSLQEEFQKE